MHQRNIIRALGRKALSVYSPEYAGYIYIPKYNLAYLAIPKNASSYIKSVLLLNHPDAPDYHPEKQTAKQFIEERAFAGFRVDSWSTLQDPKITKMVVLRDPVRRIVSGYLDKIAKPNRWNCRENNILAHDIHRHLGLDITPQEISFSIYLKYLERIPDWRRDRHTQSQDQFTKGRLFDFCGTVEDFSAIKQFLTDQGITGLDNLKPVASVTKTTPYSENTTDTPASQLLPTQMERFGSFPSPKEFIDDDSKSRIHRIYARDIDLYCSATNQHIDTYWQQYGGVPQQGRDTA